MKNKDDDKIYLEWMNELARLNITEDKRFKLLVKKDILYLQTLKGYNNKKQTY